MILSEHGTYSVGELRGGPQQALPLSSTYLSAGSFIDRRHISFGKESVSRVRFGTPSCYVGSWVRRSFECKRTATATSNEVALFRSAISLTLSRRGALPPAPARPRPPAWPRSPTNASGAFGLIRTQHSSDIVWRRINATRAMVALAHQICPNGLSFEAVFRRRNRKKETSKPVLIYEQGTRCCCPQR